MSIHTLGDRDSDDFVKPEGSQELASTMNNFNTPSSLSIFKDANSSPIGLAPGIDGADNSSNYDVSQPVVDFEDNRSSLYEDYHNVNTDDSESYATMIPAANAPPVPPVPNQAQLLTSPRKMNIGASGEERIDSEDKDDYYSQVEDEYSGNDDEHEHEHLSDTEHVSSILATEKIPDMPLPPAEPESEPFVPENILEELRHVKKQLFAYQQRDFDNEAHNAREKHLKTQQDLDDKMVQLNKMSKTNENVLAENAELRRKYTHIQAIMQGHMNTVSLQQAALDEANQKLASQQEQIHKAVTLESEIHDLKIQLKTAQSAQRHAEEQLEAVSQSYSALKTVHSDLNSKYLSTATSSKFDLPAAANLDLNVADLMGAWNAFNLVPSFSLSKEQRDYRTLYETQKSALELAHSELESNYAEQSRLKQELRQLSSLYTAAVPKEDLDALSSKYDDNISELKQKQQEYEDKLQEDRSEIQMLQGKISELKEEQDQLNNEYSKAVDLSHNQQTALTRTREELNLSRAHAHRLEEQLQDANLHSGDRGDVSTSSLGSIRNDQAALVIRDLRAQVVILEEELQSQREEMMKLKKAAVLTKG